MSAVGQPGVAKRPRPWWLGFAVMLVGAVWIWGSLKLQLSDRLSGLGAGAFVLIVGGGLVLLGAVLLFQIARGERFEAESSEDALADAPVSHAALGTVIAALILPALVMRHVGFPVTAAVSYALVARALGARNILFNLLVGIALSSLAWYGFSSLGVQLSGYFPPLGF